MEALERELEMERSVENLGSFAPSSVASLCVGKRGKNESGVTEESIIMFGCKT